MNEPIQKVDMGDHRVPTRGIFSAKPATQRQVLDRLTYPLGLPRLPNAPDINIGDSGRAIPVDAAEGLMAIDDFRKREPADANDSRLMRRRQEYERSIDAAKGIPFSLRSLLTLK